LPLSLSSRCPSQQRLPKQSCLRPAKPHTRRRLLEEAAKPAEAVKPPEPLLTAALAPYKIPDGVKLADAQIGKFNGILTKPELSAQDRGQALVDMHIGEMTRYADHLVKSSIAFCRDARRLGEASQIG